MIIDIHAHAVSEKFLFDLQTRSVAGLSSTLDGKGGFLVQRAGEQPHSLDVNLHRLERRLTSLKQRNIGLQLFGPSPGFFAWQGGAAGGELTRALHAQASEIEAQSGGLMESMAIAALGEPQHVVEELERAVDTYGFRSIMLPSSAGGHALDDDIFSGLFAFIERRELAIFMHPTLGFPSTRFGINGMNVLVGWPFETTLAVTRLIFSGVFERHPGLKLILAHGGGDLIFLRGRLDAAYSATGWEAHPYYRNKITEPPTYYLNRIYYDTCSLSPESVRFVMNTMGEDRVLFGTDFPFEVGDADGKIAISAIAGMSAGIQSKVLGGNAIKLLPAAA
jgi:aminocarboxymuconate-semialdehyde decarboxylase